MLEPKIIGSSGLPSIMATLSLVSGQLYPGYAETPGATEPFSVEYVPSTGEVYASAEYSNNVVVLNATSYNLVGSVDVHAFPSGLAYDSANDLLYVLSCTRGVVDVVNPFTLSLVTSILVPGNGVPANCDIAYDPANHDLYASTDTIYPSVVSVIDGSGQRVIANISVGVGADPSGVTFDPNTADMVVALWGKQQVLFLNSSTNLQDWNVSTPAGQPVALVSDPYSRELYVAEVGPGNAGTVSGVVESRRSIESNITTGLEPEALAFDPSNDRVDVADFEGNNIASIASFPDRLVGMFPLPAGSQPMGLSAAPEGRLVVTDWGSSCISVLNSSTGSVVTNVSLGTWPFGVAFDSTEGRVYTTSYSGHFLTAVNSTNDRIQGRIPVGDGAEAVAYDPRNRLVYVANSVSDNVSVIRAATDQSFSGVAVGLLPLGLSVDLTNGNVYVTNFNSDNVSVINGSTNMVIQSIPVGTHPNGIAVDPATGAIWVVNEGAWGSDDVSVIDGTRNRVVTNVTIWPGPPPNSTQSGPAATGISYDSRDGEMYVTDQNWNEVTVINATTYRVVANLSTGQAPWGVSYDPVNDRVYVVDSGPGSNGVTILNGTSLSVLGNVTTGEIPQNVAVDPASGRAYVTDSVRSGLTIFSSVWLPSFRVPFMEVGLPMGVHWGVALNASPSVTTTSALVFNEHNGSYGFVVLRVPGYTATPWSGQLDVDGADLSPVTVVFRAVTTPLGVLLAANASNVPSGSPATITPTVTGGISPYTCTWSLNGTNQTSPAGCAATSLSWSHPSTYNYHVWVTDSSGSSAQSNAVAIAVNVLPAPPSLKLVAFANTSATSGAVGTSCGGGVSTPFVDSFSGSARGGTPGYSFSWSFGDGSAIVMGRNQSHPYTSSGRFAVSLQVSDATGSHSWANLTVMVSASTPCKQGGNPGPSVAAIALVVSLGSILLLELVALVALRRRRRGGPRSGPPWSPSAVPPGSPRALPSRRVPPSAELFASGPPTTDGADSTQTRPGPSPAEDDSG